MRWSSYSVPQQSLKKRDKLTDREEDAENSAVLIIVFAYVFLVLTEPLLRYFLFYRCFWLGNKHSKFDSKTPCSAFGDVIVGS